MHDFINSLKKKYVHYFMQFSLVSFRVKWTFFFAIFHTMAQRDLVSFYIFREIEYKIQNDVHTVCSTHITMRPIVFGVCLACLLTNFKKSFFIWTSVLCSIAKLATKFFGQKLLSKMAIPWER